MTSLSETIAALREIVTCTHPVTLWWSKPDDAMETGWCRRCGATIRHARGDTGTWMRSDLVKDLLTALQLDWDHATHAEFNTVVDRQLSAVRRTTIR